MKKHIPTAARLVLGLIFVVFGANGFLHFIPTPPMPDAAAQFTGALAASGYFFPVLKAIEIAAGLLLLANIAVPVALTVLAPIVVQIALFHSILAPSGFGMGVVLLALEAGLAWHYRAVFAPLFAPAASAEFQVRRVSEPSSLSRKAA